MRFTLPMRALEPVLCLAVLLLAAEATPAWAEGSGEDVVAGYDGYQRILDAEARKATGEGAYARARDFYQRLIAIDPRDPNAHREAGRVAHALGDFKLAASYLERADQLTGGAPDPELHYLHGESLYALGREAKARREHERAKTEIGEPSGRMEILWLARIHARQGELERAEELYDRIEPLSDTLLDEEVALARVEARMFNEDLAGAEEILRDFIELHPDHRRARETLAWVLERRGKVRQETELRADLLERGPVELERVLSHGRARERAYDYAVAIELYRQANDLSWDPKLEDEIERLENRISPEVVAGAVSRGDPTGSAHEFRTGVAWSLGARHSISLIGSYGLAESRPAPGSPERDADAQTVIGSVLLGHGYAITGALGVSANRHAMRVGPDAESRVSRHLGTVGELRTEAGRLLQLQVRAQYNMPWREAASTIREGGRTSGATGRLYLAPIRDRLIFEAGARARRVSLAPAGDMGEEPIAEQLLLFGGVDLVFWSDSANAARGQVLDEDLLWPAHLADSFALAYRHYDASTRGSIAPRIFLAQRARVDELSAVIRKVVGRDGVLGAALRAGAGYDSARQLRFWRAGGTLTLSPFARSRFTLRYDVATESGTGFVGQRHTGWLTLHLDL